MKPRARRKRAMLRIRRREQRLYFRYAAPVLGPMTGFDLFLMYKWGELPSGSELLDRIFPDRHVAPDGIRGHE